MVNQTTMNGATSDGRASNGYRRSGASELAHDLVTLAELQSRLLSIDARQGLRAAVCPLVITLAGVVLGLACLPIGLAAAALALADATELPLSAGLAIVFGAAVVLAAALVAVGWRRVARVTAMFDRSRYEWQRNMQWLKQTLRSQGNEQEHNVT